MQVKYIMLAETFGKESSCSMPVVRCSILVQDRVDFFSLLNTLLL